MLIGPLTSMISFLGSFNLSQLFENPVVKVRKKGWHSLKYCVNMVIICVNMVILRINKRFITICLIQKYIKIDKILNILEVHVKYRGKYGKTNKI